MRDLPDHATPASRRLYDLARRLSDSCPPELASEIALVGSASIGLSDDSSDLDINFWHATIPPERARVAWLESFGATHVKTGDARPDRSFPAACQLEGMEVGCSWQTISSLYHYADIIAEGRFHGDAHFITTLTSVLVQALPLRSTGVVEAVQARLERPPKHYRDDIIVPSLTQISGILGNLRKALRYGDEVRLTSQLSFGAAKVLHLLYPLNGRWYPQDKWLYRLAGDLPIQPPDLYPRVERALHDPDPRQRPIHLARLLLDTLALLEGEYDVAAAASALKELIEKND